MLRTSPGVGITPRAADRDELSGGMTMMKGMMVTSNMRGRKNKASKAGGSKTTRGSALLLFETSCTGQCLGRSSSLCCPQGREVLRIWPGAGRTEACGRVSLLLPPFLCTGNEEARQRACLLLPGCICRDAGQVCAWRERRNLPYAPFWPVLAFSRVFA